MSMGIDPFLSGTKNSEEAFYFPETAPWEGVELLTFDVRQNGGHPPP